jgi:hypothetical protein
VPAAPYPGSSPLARTVARLHDWIWLVKRHRRRIGTWPHPWQPRSFNDWIYRRLLVAPEPLHAQLSCKLGQRDYKAARIGPDASLPLLGIWDEAAALDADWDSLPDAFMLKPTHGSSWLRAVPDKCAADRAAILAEAAGWLRRSYYETSHEIGYRDLVPRLIAEPLLPPAPGYITPWEYSLFCFGGRPALLHSRAYTPDGRKAVGFLDMARQVLPISPRPHREQPVPEPPGDAAWSRMLDLAGPLSRGTDFLRVDFLVVGDEAWAGELTPYPAAGRQNIEPAAWNDWLGAVWHATLDGCRWPDPPSGARPMGNEADCT